MSREAEERFLNLPNSLTLVRFGLAPVLAWMVLQNRPRGALLVVLLAALTDVLDGLTARQLGLRTRIGTLIDPLADKVLASTAYILLTFKGLGTANVIPLWLTATVLGRDFIIIMGGLIVTAIRGRQEFIPSVFGKASTVLQFATVFWVILVNSIQASARQLAPALASAVSPGVLPYFYWPTLAFTVISGGQYILRGIRLAFFNPT
jgi:cardiolipin synthase